MNFLRRLIGRALPPSHTSTLPVKNPYKGFTVEFYPTNGKYYATHKGDYLRRHYSLGFVEKVDAWLFGYSNGFQTEAEAWKLVDQYIEEQTKETVRVITR
jgi:hypothetical protein